GVRGSRPGASEISTAVPMASVVPMCGTRRAVAFAGAPGVAAVRDAGSLGPVVGRRPGVAGRRDERGRERSVRCFSDAGRAVLGPAHEAVASGAVVLGARGVMVVESLIGQPLLC